jgi:hypothetical protein
MNTMNSMDSILGPLDKRYCLYFYYITIIFFVLMVFTFVGMLYHAFKNTGDSKFYIAGIGMLMSYGVFYFQSRLLYSMCVGRTTDNFY